VAWNARFEVKVRRNPANALFLAVLLMLDKNGNSLASGSNHVAAVMNYSWALHVNVGIHLA
jgi:hypothetical protein